jgi:hypothetical protein
MMTEQEMQMKLSSQQEKVNELRQAVAAMNKEYEYRQQVRIQAAIAAMQGMLANPEHHKTQVESGVPCSYFYAVNAVMCADALIAELQKKGGQDD